MNFSLLPRNPTLAHALSEAHAPSGCCARSTVLVVRQPDNIDSSESGSRAIKTSSRTCTGVLRAETTQRAWLPDSPFGSLTELLTQAVLNNIGTRLVSLPNGLIKLGNDNLQRML